MSSDVVEVHEQEAVLGVLRLSFAFTSVCTELPLSRTALLHYGFTTNTAQLHGSLNSNWSS
jgi:hypothetical protein